MGCNASRLKNVELIKLCCGRYVSEAQVDSLFAPPRITKQFNYTEARAALLPFLPKMEKHDHTYILNTKLFITCLSRIYC